MNSNRTSDRTRIVLVLVAICGVGVWASESIESRWRDREIRVDGVQDEWPETVHVNEAGSVGAVNDDQVLYLSVITSDQQRRRQFVAGGLIVWLDASGGKKQSFGIQIPGLRESGYRGARTGGRRGVDETSADVPMPALTYFELLGPKKDDRRRIERTSESGIDVAAGSREGTLVYELKVPLAATSATPHAIGTKPGRKIGLGLETPKIERSEAGGRAGRGGGGGRGGFGGGGRRGGFGGGGGTGEGRTGRGGDGEGRGLQMAKPLKAWTTIQLARRPS